MINNIVHLGLKRPLLLIDEECNVKPENQYRSVNASFGTILNVMNRSFIEQLLEILLVLVVDVGH